MSDIVGVKIGLGVLAVAVVVLILGSVFLRSPGYLADEGVPSRAGQPDNQVMARLLDLNPGVWERFGPEQRIGHVQDLIDKYKRAPAGGSGGKFPALYYVISTLLTENSRPGEALDFLDQVTHAAGTDDWLHFAKAVNLENLGESQAAIGEFIQSLSFKMAPAVGQRLLTLSQKEGLDPATHWKKVRELMAGRAQDFPSFSLSTPGGQPRSLSDYENEATLVGFFFPG